MITNASISSVVHFNASFTSNIGQDDRAINLTVYNPDSYNNYLNFTFATIFFPSTDNISLTEWDVSTTVNNVPIDMDFRIQLLWYNNTAVGFKELNLTLIPELTTNLEGGSTKLRVMRGVVVNFTFNYTIFSTGIPITDAYIEEGSIFKNFTYVFINEGNGNYTIRVNTSNIQDLDLNKDLDCNLTILRVGGVPQAINLTITVFVIQPFIPSRGGGGGNGKAKSEEDLDLLQIIGVTVILVSIASIVIIILIRKKFSRD